MSLIQYSKTCDRLAMQQLLVCISLPPCPSSILCFSWSVEIASTPFIAKLSYAVSKPGFLLLGLVQVKHPEIILVLFAGSLCTDHFWSDSDFIRFPFHRLLAKWQVTSINERPWEALNAALQGTARGSISKTSYAWKGMERVSFLMIPHDGE